MNGDQSITVRRDPVVVHARQEIATVQTGRDLESGALGGQVRTMVHRQRRGDGTVVDDHIEVEIGFGPHRQRCRVGSHVLVRVRPRLPDLMDQLPKVVPRLCLGGIGPEDKRNLPARLRHATMQGEVGNQRLHAGRPDRHRSPEAVRQREPAEKSQLARRRRMYG